MTTTTDIERELARIGVLATNDQPELFNAYDDDDLPAGWARISDSACSAYGPASELLAALEAVPRTGATGYEGESVDFRATWEALCGFAGGGRLYLAQTGAYQCQRHDTERLPTTKS